jgi:hypothetical protein
VHLESRTRKQPNNQQRRQNQSAPAKNQQCDIGAFFHLHQTRAPHRYGARASFERWVEEAPELTVECNPTWELVRYYEVRG